LDLWVEQWRKKQACGDVIMVRYADDAVLGFERREERNAFLEKLRERLQKFGLELHPEKTRLIEFGRFAAECRKKRGEGKPETFNFLGFTHICGTNHQTGNFTVHRKTIGKRMAAPARVCAGAVDDCRPYRDPMPEFVPAPSRSPWLTHEPRTCLSRRGFK
jgi:hypothetical protein